MVIGTASCAGWTPEARRDPFKPAGAGKAAAAYVNCSSNDLR